jgi:hypothetical protein
VTHSLRIFKTTLICMASFLTLSLKAGGIIPKILEEVAAELPALTKEQQVKTLRLGCEIIKNVKEMKAALNDYNACLAASMRLARNVECICTVALSPQRNEEIHQLLLESFLSFKQDNPAAPEGGSSIENITIQKSQEHEEED